MKTNTNHFNKTDEQQKKIDYSNVGKIEIRNFYKSYDGSRFVLSDVNLKMVGSEIYGLVAPNGAGKTTLMKSIASICKFNGRIDYNEIGIGSHFNDRIVYSPSKAAFEDFNTKVIDYLRYIVILRNLDFNKVYEKFKKSAIVSHFENKICKDLSTGEKKIVQIFIDFLSDPEVILFDEPLNGLDHSVRKTVISNILSAAKKGKIIMISTHIFSDIDDLVDKFFVIKDGLLTSHQDKKISEVYEGLFGDFVSEDF